LLPSSQNAAIDAVVAGYLSGTRSVLPSLIKNRRLSASLNRRLWPSRGRGTVGPAGEEEG